MDSFKSHSDSFPNPHTVQPNLQHQTAPGLPSQPLPGQYPPNFQPNLQGSSVFLQPISIPNSPFPVCYIPILMNPTGFMLNPPASGAMNVPSLNVGSGGLPSFASPPQQNLNPFPLLNPQASRGTVQGFPGPHPQPVGHPLTFPKEFNYRRNADFTKIAQEAHRPSEPNHSSVNRLMEDLHVNPHPGSNLHVNPHPGSNLHLNPPHSGSVCENSSTLLTARKDKNNTIDPLAKIGLQALASMKSNPNAPQIPHMFSGPPCLQNNWRDELWPKAPLKKISEGVSEPDFREESVLETESRNSCLDVSQEIRIPFWKVKREGSQDSKSVSGLPGFERLGEEFRIRASAASRNFMEISDSLMKLKNLNSDERVMLTGRVLDEALNKYDSLPDTQEVWKSHLEEKLLSLHAVVRAIFLCEDGAKVEKLIAVSKRVPLLVFLNSRTHEPLKPNSTDSLDVDDFNLCSSSLGLFERKRRRELIKYSINWCLNYLQGQPGGESEGDFFSRYCNDQNESNGWTLDQFVRPILRRKQTQVAIPKDRDFILRLFASQKFIRDARKVFRESYYESQYRLINFKIGNLFRRLLEWLTRNQASDQPIEIKLQLFLKNPQAIFPWTILQVLEARESIKRLLPSEEQQMSAGFH